MFACLLLETSIYFCFAKLASGVTLFTRDIEGKTRREMFYCETFFVPTTTTAVDTTSTVHSALCTPLNEVETDVRSLLVKEGLPVSVICYSSIY